MPSIKQWLMVLALVVAVSGCASVEPDQFAAVQSQVYQNRQRLDRLEKQQETSRKPQAELQAEIMTLRQEVAALRGQVEENAHRLGQAPQASMAQKAEADELAKRLDRLERHLDLKPGDPARPAAKPAPKATAKPEPKAQSAQDMYDLGHKLRKKGSLDAARKKFDEVRDKYPKSSLAANSQYWIGDILYSQKRYEEAILAFNQVVKHYPKSGKAPSALLKQGLAFRALGDKRTAKIVLNRLIKSYPKSSQAASARKYLKKL